MGGGEKSKGIRPWEPAPYGTFHRRASVEVQVPLPTSNPTPKGAPTIFFWKIRSLYPTVSVAFALGPICIPLGSHFQFSM